MERERLGKKGKNRLWIKKKGEGRQRYFPIVKSEMVSCITVILGSTEKGNSFTHFHFIEHDFPKYARLSGKQGCH